MSNVRATTPIVKFRGLKPAAVRSRRATPGGVPERSPAGFSPRASMSRETARQVICFACSDFAHGLVELHRGEFRFSVELLIAAWDEKRPSFDELADELARRPGGIYALLERPELALPSADETPAVDDLEGGPQGLPSGAVAAPSASPPVGGRSAKPRRGGKPDDSPRRFRGQLPLFNADCYDSTGKTRATGPAAGQKSGGASNTPPQYATKPAKGRKRRGAP